MSTKETTWHHGYTHVYTGNGKGKSTAAFGLALRSAGAGLRVYIGQFIKQMRYSEIAAFERFPDLITVRQFGRGCHIWHTPEKEDILAARIGLKKAQQALAGGKYSVVILDEVNIAVFFHLITVEDVLALIAAKPADVELILTGRYADERIIERADLVTEMKEVKHYYRQGIAARKGIEC